MLLIIDHLYDEEIFSITFQVIDI